MSMTVLVTGATRGLGRATAIAAAARGAHVLCAGRDPRAATALADEVDGEAIHLDLSSLDDVRAVAARLPHVDAVACNAGVQLVGEPSTTVDGFEETFQVNHLAQLVLVDELLRRSTPPSRIAFVGSATHDPAIRTGTPPPHEGDVGAVAHLGPAGVHHLRTEGLRRYATTKLLAVATAAALSREHPDTHVCCFDPGLMPGTGLARQYPGPFRLLWNTALKGLRVLPFASSPSGSGRALATLLVATPPPVPSGSYVDYRLRPRNPSQRAADPAFQQAVLSDSRALLTPRSGGR